jgi:quercetin dioxygenase-like cupin family protein
MPASWHFGNARIDGGHHRGWIVGHFLDELQDGVRGTTDVEIKWGIHPTGEERASRQDAEDRTTILILISGRFRINLSVASHVLDQPGDYAMWGPGIGHSWRAEADSVVLTVRWPSLP